MYRILQNLNRHVESFSGVFLGIVAVIVFLQVVFRYVLRVTAPWTEESARYVGIWMVYAGALSATIKDDHIKVTVLTNRFGPGGKILFSVFSACVGLILCGIVFKGSIQLIGMNWKQTAVTIPVSIAVLYIPLTIFSLVSFAALLAQTARSVGALLKSGKTGGE